MKIGTHNGVFHADDCFAVAALTLLKLSSKVEVVRTRDAAKLSECTYVVDVGGVYDTTTGRFDHHQGDFYDPKGSLEDNLARGSVRANGVPYSSFGLVWDVHGEAICGDRETALAVDTCLVQFIDAADCGYRLAGYPQLDNGWDRPRSLSACISLINPTWEEPKDFDDAFGRAVEVAKRVLVGVMADVACRGDTSAVAEGIAALAPQFQERYEAFQRGTANAAELVREAQDAAAGQPVVVFDRFVPWAESVFPAENLFAVFLAETGTWMVQCIAPKPGSFEKRKALPAHWGGARDEAMDAMTGVAGCVFTHIGLFICGHKTREGALALAKLAVEA
jgi:uncharacterized UPF0160 family protein